MTQKNGRIPIGENYNQILNSHQSLGGRFEEPQGRRQGQQRHPYPNNLIQGHHENKIGDSKTHSVVPYASSSKNTSSLIAATQYGRMLPLTPPNGPPQDMGSRKNPLSLPSQLGPVQNSSFNGVGLQGYTNGFPYPLKTTFCNQMGLPYHPRGENSLRMQPQIKELLLFKDEENPISTSEIVTDAKENDEENLHLSLHL
ncbi:hypothetical protein SESBI_45024 [Sesbania bispinosa]|nr:hypothetical protein SESBI_45024 [Sesbania bispinosa]